MLSASASGSYFILEGNSVILNRLILSVKHTKVLDDFFG